jgi:nucleotide-binding universal stress UspA family protein
VAKSFTPNNKVVLFNVMLDTASLCRMDSPELTPIFRSQQSNFCALEDKKKELISAALNKAKELLVAAGYPEDNVKIKIQNSKRGVARDIIKESENGYDLIAMGRRGLSGISEFFLGSVSQKVFHSTKNISVMIVN